jgi:hypothetical protein
VNKETILMNNIIHDLNKRGHIARRHNVGVFYTANGDKIHIGNKGESDIFGHRFPDGKAFYLEVKVPGEYPRPEQYQFLSAMRATGAIADWCTSVEEAIQIVEGDAADVKPAP